jgi:conjugative relaxase-like TrwC/TraI family protein
VVGFDLTFSATKSVSVLVATGGPQAAALVAAAHSDAVTAAFAYLERRAAVVRRRSVGDRLQVAADGLVAAGFTHCLSRAVDPHLHTHVLVANLGHGPDGRWSALDGRGLFAHAHAAGALHDAHLRAALSERFGASWSWHAKSWELSGSDPVVLAAFSSRAAEINQTMWEHGSSSAGATRVAWASTREPKRAGLSGSGLAAGWARRGSIGGGEHRLDRHALDSDRLDEHRFAAAIAAGSPSGVCRRDVVAAWAGASRRGLQGPEVEAAVEYWAPASDCVIGVAEPRRAAARYVPAAHLVAALGPRPAGPGGQALWRRAAAEIDRYRERWGVVGEDPLSRPGASLSTFPARRLAEHLEVSRSVREALVRLGGRPSAARERDDLGRGRI